MDKHCMVCLNPHNHFPALEIESPVRVSLEQLFMIAITFFLIGHKKRTGALYV